MAALIATGTFVGLTLFRTIFKMKWGWKDYVIGIAYIAIGIFLGWMKFNPFQ